jgi:protoporphyrinogen oxidase
MVAYYPTYGAGQISSTMAKLIERRGGKIRLNTKLLTIRLEQSMVKSVQVLENGNLERTLTGDRFISTIPITNLFQAISPGVPPEMIKMSQQLKYRHLLLLNLIIDRKDILNHFEIFYPDKRFPFKRIYEPKKMSKKMAPEKRSSLVLEICYSDEDQFDDEKEKKIVNESIRVLEDEGILKQEEVLDLFTIKLPTAYPIYELDYETKVEKLREFLSDIENLFSCGRQGLFWYYAMTNETMEIAEVVAEMILSGKHKHQIEKRGKWSRYFF